MVNTDERIFSKLVYLSPWNYTVMFVLILPSFPKLTVRNEMGNGFSVPNNWIIKVISDYMKHRRYDISKSCYLIEMKICCDVSCSFIIVLKVTWSKSDGKCNPCDITSNFWSVIWVYGEHRWWDNFENCVLIAMNLYWDVSSVFVFVLKVIWTRSYGNYFFCAETWDQWSHFRLLQTQMIGYFPKLWINHNEILPRCFSCSCDRFKGYPNEMRYVLRFLERRLIFLSVFSLCGKDKVNEKCCTFITMRLYVIIFNNITNVLNGVRSKCDGNYVFKPEDLSW